MESDQKRVVIVGSGGRLGHCLVRSLGRSYQVRGFDRQQLNLGSMSSIDEVLGGLDYDQLFLTGALTAVDYCESHSAEALEVNAAGPGRIAEISAEKGARVTYVSTDFVFDGMKGAPYVETDRPNPISVYGVSKLAGEERVLDASKDNLVVRVSWIFGPGRDAFPEWIIAKACAGPNLTLPGDKIACPTYTLDLAEWLEALAFNPLPGGPASGVFHLCNSDPCTWREWGQFCLDTARAAGLPVVAGEIAGIPVDSVEAFIARRPVNSAMCTQKFSALTGIRPRSWTEALHEFLRPKDNYTRSET